MAKSPLDTGAEGPPGQKGAILFPMASTGWDGSRAKGGMRAGSQIPLPPWPCPSNPGHGCPAQALPESKFPHVPDQPEYGVPQALCFLTSLGPGIGGWAPLEGVKGSSQIQGPGRGSGAVLKPGVETERSQGRKRKAGDFPGAQWLRLRLPMQGTRVRALVREDPTCRGATKPMHHNY